MKLLILLTLLAVLLAVAADPIRVKRYYRRTVARPGLYGPVYKSSGFGPYGGYHRTVFRPYGK